VSRAHKEKGFTLIEMLLVASMLAAIGLTIATTFAGGLKIFNRMESYTAVKADVLLSLEKMERDLRNAFAYKGIDFIGEAHRVTFPAILTKFSSKEKAVGSLGSVSYYRDDSSNERALSREERAYSQAVKKGSSGRRDSTVLLTPVEDISFQYFVYDPEAKTYSWVNVWDKSKDKEEAEEEGKVAKDIIALEARPEELPLGVKITVSYADGGKTFALTRTVFIKTAVSLNSAKRKAESEKNNLGEDAT
jgi:prepilin-type N-terminal cleavage/methylation domain-containing protein